jgi:polysaccharide biosynthesis/export protein
VVFGHGETVNTRHGALEALLLIAGALAVLAVIPRDAAAQAPSHSPAVAAAGSAPAAVANVPQPDYVIGANDLLTIVFWRDKDMSADVVVRPDGKISLPLLNEVQAAGFTPEQLRTQLVEAAGKFLEQPNATVVVKEIHSRNAYITGKVAKPGTYTVSVDMNVMQMIALAGGLLEYADDKNIVVIRTEGGRQQYHRFNYKDVVNQKRPAQNIALRPGDTVVVP